MNFGPKFGVASFQWPKNPSVSVQSNHYQREDADIDTQMLKMWYKVYLTIDNFL